MSNLQDLTMNNEKRQEIRTSAIGLVSEMEGEFLGISLDLTRQGIRFVVPNDFSDSESFYCKFNPVEGENREITFKIQPQWRKNRNLAYDEIGAKILEVDQEKQWQELVEWHMKNKLAIKDLSFNSAQNISVRYAIQ